MKKFNNQNKKIYLDGLDSRMKKTEGRIDVLGDRSIYHLKPTIQRKQNFKNVSES